MFLIIKNHILPYKSLENTEKYKDEKKDDGRKT